MSTPRPTCAHLLGQLPCINTRLHTGGGKGCVHDAGSGVPDRHDRPGRGDSE